MLARTGGHDRAVSRHDAGAPQRVGGEAELALEPARARAEREPGDADRGQPCAGDGERMGSQCGIELAPGRPALCTRPLPRGVDLGGPHPRQVDHERAVGDGEAVVPMAAGAHGDGQAHRPRMAQRGRHVALPGAACDQRRPPVDRVVLHAPRLLEGGVSGSEQLAGEVGDRRDPRGLARCGR